MFKSISQINQIGVSVNIKKIGAGLILLVAIVLLSNVRVFKVLGSNTAFTAIEFLGPISVVFLGPIAGILAVVFGKGLSLSLASIGLFDVGRILAMPLAALYFAYYKEHKWISLIPAAAMLLFVVGPNASTAWYYSLYWLIPVAIAYSDTNNLFLRSLGSTFTAHAVGSIAFLYAFAPNPALWTALVPVVIVERVIFALGISASYVVVSAVLKQLFPNENVDIATVKTPLLR